MADCFVSRAVPPAPSLPPSSGGPALLMVCTNLFHLGRGTSPCDRRKSQGRLRDGPLRNWFLLSSLRGITHWVRSHGRGEMLNPAQQEKAKCEARKGRVAGMGLSSLSSSSPREHGDLRKGARPGSPPAPREGRLSPAPLYAAPSTPCRTSSDDSSWALQPVDNTH